MEEIEEGGQTSSRGRKIANYVCVVAHIFNSSIQEAEALCEFKASLVSIVSSKPAKTLQ